MKTDRNPIFLVPTDFSETAKRSISQFSQNLEEEQQQHAQVLQQAEAQLNELLNYQHFST